MIAARQILTHRVARAGELSAALGLEVAPRRSGTGSQPILDFPFLYPRFAAMHGPLVARADGSWHGQLTQRLHYAADISYFQIPAVDRGWSLELGGEASLRAAAHLTLHAGFRAARSRLPVGLRWHWLPTPDIRVPFEL